MYPHQAAIPADSHLPDPRTAADIPDTWGRAQLTVVMPTYNEVANLPRIAEAVLALPLPGLHLKIVDDSSPDGTGRLADELVF